MFPSIATVLSDLCILIEPLTKHCANNADFYDVLCKQLSVTFNGIDFARQVFCELARACPPMHIGYGLAKFIGAHLIWGHIWGGTHPLRGPSLRPPTCNHSGGRIPA